ncbi:MAG: hypothetical protein QOD76_2216, partial [Solirubrobacteraceae bacterium]|nr:hypothetical protein [Solirubrobacteraceae bacterium]
MITATDAPQPARTAEVPRVPDPGAPMPAPPGGPPV